MNEWEYGDNTETCFKFDFRADFDQQIKKLKSNNGGALQRGSHNYHILKSLFDGNTIDDYYQRPSGENGLPIHNVRTRVAQLRNEWNVCIGSRRVDGAPYKEYRIYGRDA
ncbi:hypothetical protein PGH07_07880 [Sulfurovum sp. zt1-1]|uniref:OmpR/PhoB-type domain-containing protein n=1 Tax=Sulfurovum zhangzhouensis TaxID=3019067 RepID=A0ABT7QZ22_9BACT|nr:hypothetical protein [Sulfurovum zhangzhouensis]MDM5272096.1 hypothetical protein [Sulfurovum zhangzhouensis]